MIDIEEIGLQSFTDEDDPLVALYRHRREISERFETVEDLTTYLKQFNSVEDALEKVRAKMSGKSE